jgi:hypothetical protein
MCLDVLRVLAKQQGISELLHDAFGAVKGRTGILIVHGASYSNSCVNL